jgi:hypothetical protein
MAKRTAAFNLSEAIREVRKQNRGISCRDALVGIRSSYPSQKINEGTFKSTFYKLAGGKKKPRRKVQLAQVSAARVLDDVFEANQGNWAAIKDALKFLAHFESAASAALFLEFVADVKDAVLA